MRIISGTLGSRNFNAPKGHKTHPMGDRIRVALFNTLGDLSGKTILDAYAGSGALSFESISRGAESALAIDIDKNAYRTINENIKSLGVENSVKAINANCKSWSNTAGEQSFDIIFCDPPYGKVDEEALNLLSKRLNSNGLMIISYQGRESAPTVNGVVVVDSRIYGDAALAFYRQ